PTRSSLDRQTSSLHCPVMHISSCSPHRSRFPPTLDRSHSLRDPLPRGGTWTRQNRGLLHEGGVLLHGAV
ncbi:hypothetical protein PENTCL1PPCAC_4980, partial [Pristionchus entomophagus]